MLTGACLCMVFSGSCLLYWYRVQQWCRVSPLGLALPGSVRLHCHTTWWTLALQACDWSLSGGTLFLAKTRMKSASSSVVPVRRKRRLWMFTFVIIIWVWGHNINCPKIFEAMHGGRNYLRRFIVVSVLVLRRTSVFRETII